VTSVPFSTQYEYSPSYNDFGHTDDPAHFFRQMDYLTPELYRALMPGRILAVHVKDRIVPGQPLGPGLPDRLPVQRRLHRPLHAARLRLPRPAAHQYGRRARERADLPPRLERAVQGRQPHGLRPARVPPRLPQAADRPQPRLRGPARRQGQEEYTRARWQFDADGFARSSGDRLLTPEDLRGLAPDQVFKAFRAYTATHVYDHEHVVALAESLEAAKMLPPSFKLLQLWAHGEHTWPDVARMRTLNAEQASKGREMHLCPLQFDIVDRAIVQYTNPGEEVYDPFGGLMTVPLRAVQLGRRGRAAELNRGYWTDGVWHLRRAEAHLQSPTLFDLEGTKEEAAA
jgi:hypothetical protein